MIKTTLNVVSYQINNIMLYSKKCNILKFSHNFAFLSYSVRRTFATAVSNRLKQDVFRSPGQNTYLIPIDDGLVSNLYIIIIIN